jgi:thioesterase domain-containing protein
MNKDEYENLRKAVEDTFTSLYVLDVGSLTAEQRNQHQEALGAAYLAVIRLENKRFSELTDQAKNKLEALKDRALALQKQLAGLKRAKETLEIVASALGVLTSIAKLLR